MFLLLVRLQKDLTMISNNVENTDPLGADLAYQQALQYGKDLAQIYVVERAKHQQLEIAHQVMSAVFASSPDGLLVLDEALTIQQANEAFAQLVEVPAEALVGQTL